MRFFILFFFGFLFCEEAISEKCALVIQSIEDLTPSAAEIESRPKASIGGVDATLHPQRHSGMRTVHDRPIVAYVSRPLEFVESWYKKITAELPPGQPVNPRLKQNLELLKWGINHDLLHFNVFDSIHPKDRNYVEDQGAIVEGLVAYLSNTSSLRSLSHEFDHLAFEMEAIKKQLAAKGIASPSYSDLESLGDFQMDTPNSLFKKEKQAMRMERRTPADSAESEMEPVFTFRNFAYPRAESSRVALEQLKAGTQSSHESEKQIQKNFYEAISLSIRFRKSKKLPEFGQVVVNSKGEKVVEPLGTFPKPDNDIVTIGWLKYFLSLSGNQGRFQAEDLKLLLPLAQQAWTQFQIQE